MTLFSFFSCAPSDEHNRPDNEDEDDWQQPNDWMSP